MNDLRVDRRTTIVFAVVAFLSSYRLWSESVKADVEILRILLDQNLGLMLYLLGILAIVAIGFRYRHLERRIPMQRAKYVLVGVLLIASVGGFLIGTYPPIDEGPDHDEATEAWIDAFLEGDYPYNPAAHAEYQVSELTVFPSIPLYSIPLFMIYDVAFSMVFGVLAISLLISSQANSDREGALALFALFLSVPLHFRLISHSNYIDLIALTIIGLVLLSLRRPLVAGFVFGVLFAAKTNTWPLLPVIGVAVLDKWAPREAVQFAMTAGVVGLGFIAPFVLWDPQTFFNVAPLGVATGHLNTFGVSTPVLGAAVVLVSLIAYGTTLNLMVGLILGSTVLFLGFPGRYQLFLSTFVITWAFTQINLECDDTPSRIRKLLH